MKPEQLPSLSIAELSLLVEWAFEVRGIRTLKATVEEESFDLELINEQEGNRLEYMRFYSEPPVSAVYHLTAELKGRDIKKIYLFTLDRFSAVDKNAQRQNPLFLELREYKDIIGWFEGTKTTYRKTLQEKHYYVIPQTLIRKSKTSTLLSKFKRMLLKERN
jgi:hypothetical protein